ncbi:hypothetical protein MNB_SV-6-657 [hydrothermal vent metagenome]|uniref:Uncharacterized protein n=1 Tax=hydrothermal vent metagenome TaxID=652676 RepID=A0A1W1BQD5_9ZZZZ
MNSSGINALQTPLQFRVLYRLYRKIDPILKKIPFLNEEKLFLSIVQWEVENHKSHIDTSCKKLEDLKVRDFKLDRLEEKKERYTISTPSKLQFVFISIDIDNIIGTIDAIDRYIDFVDSYIIVTRADMVDSFNSIESIHEIVVIDESSILEDINNFKDMDHQSKNWILRASLLKIKILQEQFVMLDDDNRPLRDISIEHYIEDGKYQCYYYYDLDRWYSYSTEYDLGQHNTRELLSYEGFERLSYSSHKPQIIDKRIFQEVVDRYYHLAETIAIDEWSIYFNYATYRYPELFEKRVFDVLNWPDHPSRWELVYEPKEYNFENYYPHVYKTGIFANGENLTLDEKIALKQKEYEPYRKVLMLAKDAKFSNRYDKFRHHCMKFVHNKEKIYIYNMPTYLHAPQGSIVKILLDYKSSDILSDDIKMTYRINGDFWLSAAIHAPKSIDFRGKVYVMIHLVDVPSGFYNLLMDITFDGIESYGGNSPYLVKLSVK